MIIVVQLSADERRAMFNPDDNISDLRKYLKKLRNTIEKEALFSIFDSKIMDKKKVDDILCCIEASFPKEYRDFVKTNGINRLRSSQAYMSLQQAIKNKFFFSTNLYEVIFSKTIASITALEANLDSDMRLINNEQ